MKFERDFLRYFEQVEAGDIVVCDKVAKAVMRALAEIRNPGQWHYSEAMAAKHIGFMHSTHAAARSVVSAASNPAMP